jgi:hypothetical protein
VIEKVMSFPRFRRKRDLTSMRIYWRTRTRYLNLLFSINRIRLNLRLALENTSTQASILSTLFRSSVRPILPATLAAFLILGASVAITSQTSGASTFIISVFEPVDEKNQEIYKDLLIAIVTVVGIFLTLYFTNLSTVVGTLYAEMPARVRNLVIQERVGNISINFLIFLIIYSLLLLLAETLFGMRPKIAIVTATALGCVTVPIFVSLSARTFRFLDPTTFTDTVIPQLIKWSRNATIEGFLWNDPSFQRHYHQQSSEALLNLQSLAQIIHDKPQLQTEAQPLFLTKISSFVVVYLDKKRQIPLGSLWYVKAPVFKDWYLTDYTQLALASSTRTSLQPEMKPDRYWLENALLELLTEAILKCTDSNRQQVTFRVLQDFLTIFEAFGEQWEIQFAKRMLPNVFSSVTYLNSTLTGEDLNSERFNLEQLQSIEYLGLYPIYLLLGFRKGVEQLALSDLSQIIFLLNWKSKRAIYQLGLPTSTLKEIEEIQQKLEIEVLVEGQIISSGWYIQQLVFQQLALRFKEQLIELVSLGSAYYLPQIEHLITQKRYLLAAQFITRGLEFYHKVFAHLVWLRQWAENLDRSRVLQGLRWPEWNWEQIEKMLTLDNNTLVVRLAQCIPHLMEDNQRNDIPDLAGQAISTVQTKYLEALINNDVELASKLFEPYFQGCIGKYVTLSATTQVDNYDIERQVIVSAQPLIDLFEISGYAYLFAEFHRNAPLWNTCQIVWEWYLTQLERIKAVEKFANTIYFVRKWPTLTSRSVLRNEWKLRIRKLFENLPRKYGVFTKTHRIPHGIYFVDHPSLLVRVMGSGDTFHFLDFCDPLDIFVDLYLKKKPGYEKLEFGGRKQLERKLLDHQELERKVRIIDLNPPDEEEIDL